MRQPKTASAMKCCAMLPAQTPQMACPSLHTGRSPLQSSRNTRQSSARSASVGRGRHGWCLRRPSLYIVPYDTVAPLNRALQQCRSTHEECGGVATGWAYATLGLREMLSLLVKPFDHHDIYHSPCLSPESVATCSPLYRRRDALFLRRNSVY
jgi:hypothetical protein